MAGTGIIYPLKPSFAGGELTPALYGRTDLQKYDVGAAKIENAIVLRYGGVSRRPGFRYVAKTLNNNIGKLVPFRYNTEQNYVLEFTAGRIRFFANGGIIVSGGVPVEVITPYTDEELKTLKYTQSADVLFLVQPDHPPAMLTRTGATSWNYQPMDISLGPFDDANSDTDVKLTPSAATGSITISANADVFESGMVGRSVKIGHMVPSQYVQGNPNSSLEISCPGGATVYVETFGFWSGTIYIQKWDKATGGWVTIQGQSNKHNSNYNFKFTNDADEIVAYRVTSTDFDPSTWASENPNQTGYVVIQTFAQDYYGVAKITAFTNAQSVTATVKKQLGAVTPTSDFAFQAWDDNKGFPNCAGFFEDRLIFAGSKTKPQTYWCSKSGDYTNFGQSVPIADDDAIIGTLTSGQMNGIKAMVPFSEMLMFTSGGEYKVGGGSDPFTPSNQQAKPQEYRGINDLTPVVIGGRVVYVQHQGSIVRDLTYSYDVDKYTGDDVSILAAHLFEGHTITGLTFQQTPNSVVWCVRDDGVLLGMTYIKEQDVYAWHQHTTNGEFIDVCSISGTDSDELWAVIKRGDEYFVEQMASQVRNTNVMTQFFVDAGYIYDGTPTNTVTGLTWLMDFPAEDIQIIADGNMITDFTITDSAAGTIELSRAYSKIVVGLRYDMTIKTMPIEINARDGSFASRRERIAKMSVLFRDTRGGKFGIKESALDEIKWRATEDYDEPVQLYEGKKSVVIPQATYSDTIQLIIRQEQALPMTILSIVPEVTAGG